MEEYHHGVVIKRYRERKNWTQKKLSENWPNGGCGTNYVYKVEKGETRITDTKLLRELSTVLDIPLWEFGLSEYDPFNKDRNTIQSAQLYSGNLDLVAHLIEQAWYLRKVAPIPEVEKTVKHLFDLFNFFRVYAPPPLQMENRYLQLFAQAHRLAAIVNVENKKYPTAIRHYKHMYEIGRTIDDPATMAIALLGKGAELERMGEQQCAVDNLEEGRDLSFRAGREVACLVNAYLARTYASNHQPQKFLRAIDTAQSLAGILGDKFGSARDFAFYSISGVLAERSYGYLEIGQPEKTLEMRDEIMNSVRINENTWLHAWIPLDWARAYLMLGEIEESIKETREFYIRAMLLESPHATSRAEAMVRSIENAGYGNVPLVKDLREELRERNR